MLPRAASSPTGNQTDCSFTAQQLHCCRCEIPAASTAVGTRVHTNVYLTVLVLYMKESGRSSSSTVQPSPGPTPSPLQLQPRMKVVYNQAKIVLLLGSKKTSGLVRIACVVITRLQPRSPSHSKRELLRSMAEVPSISSRAVSSEAGGASAPAVRTRQPSTCAAPGAVPANAVGSAPASFPIDTGLTALTVRPGC